MDEHRDAAAHADRELLRREHLRRRRRGRVREVAQDGAQVGLSNRDRPRVGLHTLPQLLRREARLDQRHEAADRPGRVEPRREGHVHCRGGKRGVAPHYLISARIVEVANERAEVLVTPAAYARACPPPQATEGLRQLHRCHRRRRRPWQLLGHAVLPRRVLTCHLAQDVLGDACDAKRVEEAHGARDLAVAHELEHPRRSPRAILL